MTEVDRTGRHWHKSGRSNTTHGCVECAVEEDTIVVRDSKDPDGPVLTFAPDSWRDFIAAVKAGEFDRPRTLD